MSGEGSAKSFLRRASRWFVETYCTADPRSLGLFRIALGALLFVDVLRRYPDLAAHYSNVGWLTNHFALYRPMSGHLFSVYLPFSSLDEVRLLFFLHLVVNALLLIGFHTRLMHVLAAILITSLNSRNILLENGGWVVLGLLTVWTMFLPTGLRFSVDAFRASWRRRKQGTIESLNERSLPAPPTAPVRSLAVLALLLQWVVIYYFNVVHKSGQPWRDGTAIHYFLEQDRMITWFGGFVRDFLPLGVIRLLTWSTLLFEATIAALLVLPGKTHLTRMLAALLVVVLHLSIDAVVQLGPFSWAMIVVFFVFVPRQFWQWLERRAAAREVRQLYVDENDGFSLTLAGWVKRCDVYRKVRFVPLEPDSEKGSPSALARRTLVVSDESGEKVWRGAAAARTLLGVFGIPRVAVRALGFRPFRALLDRVLRRLIQRRRKLSRFFELEKLPGSDARAPEPTPARCFAERANYGLGQAAVLLLMVATASQVLVENRAVPRWLKPSSRPAFLEAIVYYPRLFQGWSMFAPSPPNEDGRLVVVGTTEDGRSLDPLTGGPPRFELQAKRGFGYNQIWGDFHRRIAEPRFRAYLPGVADFLQRHHELTGRSEDALVAFELWQVTEIIPPPETEPAPPQKRKLWSWTKPGLQKPAQETPQKSRSKDRQRPAAKPRPKPATEPEARPPMH